MLYLVLDAKGLGQWIYDWTVSWTTKTGTTTYHGDALVIISSAPLTVRFQTTGS
jgi:hypothetical protein